MIKWIQQWWQPEGHIDLKLGAKGFFSVIFSNLEDKENVFKDESYLFNNVEMFMRKWEEWYNPDKEKFLATPIWVRLFSLPMDFWVPEILEEIGNPIGTFVKVAKLIRKGRYNSYARICVYMNINEPLLDYIELNNMMIYGNNPLTMSIFHLDADNVMNMATILFQPIK